jgi:hypothetical protein
MLFLAQLFAVERRRDVRNARKKRRRNRMTKKCNLNCAYALEGYCAIDSMTKGKFKAKDCKAKTEQDLMEFDW